MIAPDATTVLLAERHTNDYLYQIILSTTVANQWHIGGSLATRLLYESAADIGAVLAGFKLEDFALEIYCQSADRSAGAFAQLRKLTDDLQRAVAKQTVPHFVMLRNDISHQQYSIMLDGSRLLVTIYELSQKFMGMITHGTKPRHVGGLLLLPQKAQLVDIYRDLYQPRPDLWESQFPRAMALHKHVEGGGDKQCGSDEYRQKILNTFVKNNKNVILIGDHAVRLLGGQPPRNRIIQLLAVGVEQLAEAIAELIDGEVFTMTEPIMRDMRLQRTTVRCSVDMVHIYHNLEYDVIGYRMRDGYRIGIPAVLLRFILIDYWILIGKYVAGRVPEQFFKTKKQEVLENLNIPLTEDDYADPDNYMGQYYSDNAYAKAARRETKFLPPYYGMV